MSVTGHLEFDNHEAVCFFNDSATGLRAIVALHSTTLGPAFGGCRMYSYASEDAALTDALRLSRGMSYKNALAGLSCGGGKAVIIGNPASAKTPDLLRAFGKAVETLGGRYVTAEDAGIGTADVAVIREATEHVRKLPLDDGGNPSPCTAWGVFKGMDAAWRHIEGRGLAGALVAIEGLGGVGMELARLLYEAGAKLVVNDTDSRKVSDAVGRFGAREGQAERLHAEQVDIYSPCAMGGTLNERTIPELRARLVAGGANNQLAAPSDGELLMERGVTYCPDYVINAGGVLSVPLAGEVYDRQRALDRAAGLVPVLLKVLATAEREKVPTQLAADRLAESRLAGVAPRGRPDGSAR